MGISNCMTGSSMRCRKNKPAGVWGVLLRYPLYADIKQIKKPFRVYVVYNKSSPNIIHV